MLMRTDPFRELDRLTHALGASGTLARPSAMPMDAWRDGDTFQVEFDLPGVDPDSVELDVERNVVTVRAERPQRASDAELIAAERPRGVFSRQLILGDTLDTDRIAASYDAGVLTLKIPGRGEGQTAQDLRYEQGRGRPTPSTPERRETVMYPLQADRVSTVTTDEAFLAIVVSDEQLVRAEFDAIIAAQWPTRGSGHSRQARAAPSPFAAQQPAPT